MRILFDLRKTGLGNNGGSLTIIKSANMLVKLGHTVIFIDSMKNQNTWFELNAAHMIIKDESKLPDADFIIATGYKSVESTVSAPARCGQKCHYLRAWETWAYSEEDIFNKVLKQPTIKLVNSICLRDKLSEYGFPSYIVYPGYDFEDFYPLNLRDKTKYVIFGGLYREGIHGDRKRVSWLLQTAMQLKTNYTNVKVYLFGSEKDPKNGYIDKYIQGPDIKDKNNFYNMCHVWLAPTMSEGLHLPPAEAMLTECPVVGTTAELSGMQDYLIDGVTGVVTKNDLRSFINGAESLVKDEEKRTTLGKRSREQILSIGSREKNMTSLISLLERLK